MYAARQRVAGSNITPVYAKVPINGGKAPTTAPASVLSSDFRFIGMYIQR